MRLNPDAPAIATGTTQAGAFAGAALGPLVFGLAAQQISFRVAWGLLAAIGVVAAFVMLAAAQMAGGTTGPDQW